MSGGSSPATGKGGAEQLREGQQRSDDVPDESADSGQPGSGDIASGERTSPFEKAGEQEEDADSKALPHVSSEEHGEK